MQPVEEAVVLAFVAAGVDLELAVGDIVADRVARDVTQGVFLTYVLAALADDHAQLDLPVHMARRDLGDANRVAGMSQGGAGRLPEEIGIGLLACKRLLPAAF